MQNLPLLSSFASSAVRAATHRWQCLLFAIVALPFMAAATPHQPDCVFTPVITGNLQLCPTTSLTNYATTTLSAAGATAYAWSTGATTPNISVATPGSYTVTATATSGCVGTASVTVIGSGPTSAGSIGYDEVGCGSPWNPSNIVSTAPASGNAAGTTLEYVWIFTTDPNTVSGGANNFSAIGTATNVSFDPGPITQTTWFRRCVRVVGCAFYAGETGWVKKEIRPGATAAITGRSVFCEGESSTLTATGGGSYRWSNGATTAATTISASGTYTVTVTNANGCTASTNVLIIVHALPQPVILGSSDVCGTATTLLTATGGDTYIWSTGATTAAIVVGGGAYTVTAYSIHNCTATVSKVVKSRPNPTLTVAGATAFCAGSSTTLIATSDGTILWSTGATTASITVNTAGLYSVTATSTFGCKTVKYIQVATNSATASIAGGGAVCNGITSTLTATGGGTYAWSNGATSAAITVAAGTYTVTVTNNGCVATATKTITNTAVTASIAGGGAVCNGATSTLTATGGGTYAWSNGATSAAITVGAGTYTVTVTNNGCTATATKTITNTTVTASIAGGGAVCNGATSTLTATGGGTYAWSNGATSAAITVAAGTYTVTVTNGGCVATATKTITNTAITASIAGGGAVCNGATATLTATGGGAGSNAYLWSNGATSAAITVGAGTYTVTVTNNGCTATAAATVTTAANPIPTITCKNVVCLGESVTITAAGGGTYAWSNGSVAAVFTVTPTTTTTYTVTVTNAAGCTASVSRTVTVRPTPSASISGNAAICNGGTTTLTAASNGATVSYAWNTGVLTNVITVNPTATTTYTVTVTNEFGCTAVATKTVTVGQAPTPAITGVSPICAGSSTLLTATGGSAGNISYAWSNGTTAATTTVSPTATTTYTVTATSATGCTATATKVVSVQAAPTAVIAGNTSICLGSNTTLTASGGFSYAWSNGAGSAATTVAPSATTTYTVTATSLAGCKATKSITVIVNSIALQPMANVAICAGNSATVGYTSTGLTYAWSNGATTGRIMVAPTATTIYTVTATTAAGCTATASVTISINPNPTVSVNSTAVCAGASAILSTNTTNTASLAWSNGGTGASISVAPSSTTTYTVTATSANGCKATASGVVTINALPTVTITGNRTLCAGGNTTLTATGGTAFVWDNGSATAAITVAPSTTTTYYVTVGTANGCIGNGSATVVVNSLPNPSISGVTTVCAGQTASLTATGGNTYAWSNGAATATISVTATATTTYTVTATNGFGCTKTLAQTVTVNALPIVAISGNTSICAGSITTLTASGGTSYFWNPQVSGAAITIAPTATTIYIVTVTNSRGCTATKAVTVTVNPTPTPSVTGTTTICAGSSTTLTAAGGSSYAWSTGGATAIITASPTVNTIYTVTITNTAGCTATASVAVRVLAAPTVAFTNTQPIAICAGTCTLVCATGGGSYVWNTAATTPTIQVCPTATTTYTVTITNSQGCTTSKSITVTVNPSPTAAITTATTSVCAGSTVSMTATGGSSYAWSTGATTTAITFTATNTATYYVTVTNATGCTASASKTITVNPRPVITATCDPIVCTGSTLNLTAVCAQATGFAWSGPNGFTSNSPTPAILTATTAMSGTYFITCTNANGCTATASAMVTVQACNNVVGDFVWNDTDKDGVQDATEAGVQGVTVTLYNSSNTAVATTTTDAFGEYAFTFVAVGSYTVGFSNLPAYYVFTTQSTSNDTGSDANASGRTNAFTVTAGTSNYSLDAGIYYGKATIGDYVWYDQNGNGLQDNAEAGIANTEVRLLSSTGTLLSTTTTNASGYYSFAVVPGSYVVEFYRAGWSLTTQTIGTTNGSDANVNTGRTDAITVVAGENRTDIDAGFKVCACIAGGGSNARVAANNNNNTANAGVEVARAAMSIFPNPISTDVLTVKITTESEDANATVVLIDLMGNTVRTERVTITNGTNYLKLDVNNLPNGTYFVRVVGTTVHLDAQKLVRISD